ncbi:hypothetical protein GOP47_0006809 [Adiantum capillus-veneris]|uniref:Uncharacterized protein n=1 Tax=Adiantum capillus-veneris TaxID=13818 RepID=A0A9D4V3T1_ADICA|nr:hypothetical protein GOP47_0006809 [Adiantum capillus-veneris]
MATAVAVLSSTECNPAGPAQKAASPAVLQEFSNASEELSNAALKLPSAPLQLIPLPSHRDHKTEPDITPSSVPVSSAGAANATVLPVGDASDVDAVALPAVEVPKAVIEFPVPGARETHEMAVVGPNMLVVTQQSNSTLVKVQLSPITGRPLACARFLLGDFWAGLHGLCASQIYPNQVWASMQFKSLLLRIEPGLTMDSAPQVMQVITLPSSVYGPHCVCECGPDLWTGCKDSYHMVRINHSDPTNYSVYPCSARPIFMARHPTSLDMYASLDSSSKIWHLVVSTGQTEELDIPSAYGNTPVGLVAGTDGNVWFTLLGDSSGGNGTFARILPTGEFQWFTLTTPVASNAGLIHLAFDWHEQFNKRQLQSTASSNLHRLWLLSSTLVADAGKSVDAVFSVLIDSELGRITTQQSIFLPTQRCYTHRVLPHRTGLFVSQLWVSSLAHITGAAAFNAEGLPSETCDAYSHFGIGVPQPQFTYQLELPTRQRIATRMPPCPLPAHENSVEDRAKPEQTGTKPEPTTRPSKRARSNSAK